MAQAQAQSSALPAALPSQPLTVLHWWTSAGERQAFDDLSQHLIGQGMSWRSEAVHGGGGGAAGRVLQVRTLSQDPPHVAQLVGRRLTEWAQLGLVLPLTSIAQSAQWQSTMFPIVWQSIHSHDKVLAAPLGVHRTNWLYYNEHLWRAHKLPAPTTWEAVESAARQLAAAGVQPLAWSDEPWQVLTVFEALLLGEAGAAQYAQMVSAAPGNTWTTEPVRKALQRLRWLRGLNAGSASDVPWYTAGRLVYQGKAGMMLMGDWLGGEFKAWGFKPGTDYGCVPTPATAGMHLYSVDSLAMLATRQRKEVEQWRLADALVQPATQMAFNQAKGSVPVRHDMDPSLLDLCAQQSWRALKDAQQPKLPSVAHRMAAQEMLKDELGATLSRFVKNPAMTVEQAQQRLVTIVHGLN